jgi:hypothetical protein
MKKSGLFLVLCFLIIFLNAGEQLSINNNSDSTFFNNKRNFVFATYTIGTSLSFGGLYYLWYAENGMSGFKFFNDNRDWLQMDKLGHATSSYQLGEYGIKALRWAGLEDRKAILQGAAGGLIFLTIIELMDGFANDYGFSCGDMIANTIGTGMLVGQEFLWQGQRIRLKYSFCPSDYAQYRPELLGKNIVSQSIKDYNAQTFWLSANFNSTFNTGLFPDWLNFAFGYSAFGMTGGSNNPQFNAAGDELPEFDRTRQYLFSLDIDLTKLEPKSKFLKTVFSVFGFVKIPFTALEYNSKDGFMFHPIYL